MINSPYLKRGASSLSTTATTQLKFELYTKQDSSNN